MRSTDDIWKHTNMPGISQLSTWQSKSKTLAANRLATQEVETLVFGYTINLVFIKKTLIVKIKKKITFLKHFCKSQMLFS